jgi:predicted acetyltransferase
MSSALQLRELGPDDVAPAGALGALAFGDDPARPAEPPPAGSRSFGVLDGDRMVALATLRPYGQWWGGRAVPMGGIAGVAVHPDARGQGAVGRLGRELIGQMRQAGHAVSVLFPTAPGIYRSLGWELVGGLERCRLPTAVLGGPAVPGVRLRTAGPADEPVLARLWQAHAAGTDGALTRDGPSWPRGLQPLLEHQVVTLAEQDGVPTGYLVYDRGRGYGEGSELSVHELVASTPATAQALVRALGSWDSVAPTLKWRGPTDDLALLLRGLAPVPVSHQPWMLRVVDAPAAFAARGYPAGTTVDAAFTLIDPDVPEHEGPWRLQVAGGRARLEPGATGSPRLDVGGLALLFAGVARSARLVRTGLLEQPVPELDALAGPVPQLLDYF